MTNTPPPESPSALYAEIFQLPLEALEAAFRAQTRLSEDQISRMMSQRDAGPLGLTSIRMRLAREVVSLSYGFAATEAAEAAFLSARACRTQPPKEAL
ncbi:hypothetical protein KKF91_12690 [Myxococcota bacterium]|nr:hypothetical protein [Myxococcota bacterium]MBU1431391.1 hypothetical protein [Myxococcota bacterium]MBU1900512.1 hypothetical protein [Myxococcota bacterium]